jgi:hypothetical protein
VTRRLSTTVVVVLFVAAMIVAMSASDVLAAAPPRFAQVPEDGERGEGAGRFYVPEGIVAEQQLPGHVFVIDQGNDRIDEFTAWGEFVKAWGWGVSDGNPELETCTVSCREGIHGFGTGQFQFSEGLAVDSEGNVYVMEYQSHRVQKFDPDGGPGGEAKFVLMFGWKVNKTKESGSAVEADVCAAGSGDVCQVGSAGSGPGQFGAGSYRDEMAASPVTNAVFVGENEHIQVFERDGVFKEEIKMPAGKIVEMIATDTAGDLYVRFNGEAEVHKLEPHGPAAVFLSPVFKLESSKDQPRMLAVDGSGHMYVVVSDFGPGAEPARVLEFDASGNCLLCGTGGEGGKQGFDRTESETFGVAATSACGSDDAYVTHYDSGSGDSFFRVFGQTPDPVLCPPPRRPPAIDEQYPSVVETGEATLKASINPHFWSGVVGTTTYYVQYATQACFEAGGWGAGCVKDSSVAPGSVLGGGSVNEDVSVSVTLGDLASGTAYRYRFVAEGSGEPGDVIGVGGRPGNPGADGSFTTFSSLGAESSCPANGAFRIGPSALLPDCRVYELVSPVDKEGGDVVVLKQAEDYLPAVLSESSGSGERLAYGSARSFGGAESAPYTIQYVAARHAGTGWVTHAISPPHGKNLFGSAVLSLDTEFRLFSPDLCEAWVQSFAEVLAGPPVPAGIIDVYRRSDNECGGPAYQPLNTVAPLVAKGEQFQIELQGVSEDGATAVFQANDALTEEATPAAFDHLGNFVGLEQIYGVRDGIERFLCVLPEEGGAWTGPCTTGGGGSTTGNGKSREGDVTGAVSSDGNEVFWTDNVGNPGKIYVRVDPFGVFGPEGQECVGNGSPCTFVVSKAAEEEAGTSDSQFWAAAKDGSKALFTTGGRLYEYRVGDSSTHPIAGEVLGLLGQSEDATRVYLVSREAMGGANARGKSASPGAPNLYFYEGGVFHFIGALGTGDLSSLTPFALEPYQHVARVSGDGLHAAFMSTASLTGYDNTDAVTGAADAEVFLYDAAANSGDGKLVCASCNPSGTRPHGAVDQEGVLSIRAAGKIAVPENMFYPSRVLSADGKRLFFESYDALTPVDTNGQQDVYEWEASKASPPPGGCSEASPTYSLQDQGCVVLISSGKSTQESSFVDASPSGDDVFFATLSSLVPQDAGLVDIYDARVDGGFPAQASQSAVCEGEACQTPAVSPPNVTPGSLTFSGPGDLVSSPTPGAIIPKSKGLTRAQKLATALKVCRRVKPKHKRVVCESKAHKAYGAKRASTTSHAGTRKGA